MGKHGDGPKDVWVIAYERQQGDKRVWVQSHLRHTSHKLSCLPSADQYDFGF